MDLLYWLGAVRSIGRNLADSGFARELATSGLRHEARPRARSVELLDALPEVEGLAVQIGQMTFRRSNLDPTEQFALAAIACSRKPKRIVEIGTYDGASTLLMARNAPDAHVWTLDLPPELSRKATVEHEGDNVLQGVGTRFRGTDEALRITQLLGDSRTFDFSPWYGTADLVLVDGGHEYECVRVDTDNALKLVSPEGMIVWDDYLLGWPGVVRAVDETALPVQHFLGTGLAVYDRLAHPASPRTCAVRWAGALA